MYIRSVRYIDILILCICISLLEKCPYSELFWSAFSSIRTDYGEILCIRVIRLNIHTYIWICMYVEKNSRMTSSSLKIYLTSCKPVEFINWKIPLVSHKKSLIRCIENKLIPKGLELLLEPTVGDYDQEFIDNWYSNLKEFYFILMKDIVKFCGKTIEETQIKLKQNLDKGEYDAFKTPLK